MAEWKVHPKYRRRYLDYIDEGRHFRRWDNMDGPVVSVDPTPTPSAITPRTQPIIPSYPQARDAATQPGVDLDPWGVREATGPSDDRFGLNNSPSTIVSQPTSDSSSSFFLASQYSSFPASTQQMGSFADSSKRNPAFESSQPLSEGAFSRPRRSQMQEQNSSLAYQSSNVGQGLTNMGTSIGIASLSNRPIQVPGTSRDARRPSLPENYRLISSSRGKSNSRDDVASTQSSQPSNRSTTSASLLEDERGDSMSHLLGELTLGGSTNAHGDLSGTIDRDDPICNLNVGSFTSGAAPRNYPSSFHSTGGLPTSQKSILQRVSENLEPDSVASRLPSFPNEPAQQLRDQTNVGEQNKPTVHRFIRGTVGEVESLDTRYMTRKKPVKYFVKGRVFALLWSEPLGESGKGSEISKPNAYRGKYGQEVYQSIRRMVVVRDKRGYCSCIPISTYQGRGTSKPGLDQSTHSIIYMDGTTPTRLRSEEGIVKEPILVIPANPDQKLNKMSRINFAKTYTVEHNVKVMTVGRVDQSSMVHLETYWKEEM